MFEKEFSMTIHHGVDSTQPLLGAPLEGDAMKQAYHAPRLTCNGRLEKITLQYTFNRDGICITPGQTLDNDPDCG